MCIIYLFWAVLGLHCCAGFSRGAASGGSSLVVVFQVLVATASLSAEHVLKGPRASVGSVAVAQAQPSWPTGLVSPRHAGSFLACGISQIRDQTPVSCIGRWFFTTGPPGKPQVLTLLRLSVTHSPPSLSDRKSLILSNLIMCFPGGSDGKESAYNEEGH